MHVSRMVFHIACAAAFLAGCSGDGGEGGGTFTERDSAGVRIAESTGAAWGDGQSWEIAAQPDLSVGLADGDKNYLFGELVGAVALESGRVVIADAQSGQLSYFDKEGKFLFTRGGLGGGPGEMDRLSMLSKCGGASVHAFDRGTRRVQTWDESGELTQEFELLEPDKNRLPYRIACGRNGFVANGWGDLSALGATLSTRFYTQNAPAWVFDTAGKVSNELGTFIQSERLFVMSQGGGSSGPHPLGRSTVLAMGDSAVYVGTSEQFDVRVFGLDGRLKAIYRGPSRDSAYTKQFLETYRTADLEGEAASSRYFVEKSGWLMSPGIPVYSEMVVDPEQNVWLRRFKAPWESVDEWAVFGSSGRYMGNVGTPQGLRIKEIGVDYVLGITTDSLGVQRVQRHRLSR